MFGPRGEACNEKSRMKDNTSPIRYRVFESGISYSWDTADDKRKMVSCQPMSKWSPVSTNVKMVSRVNQCQNGLPCQPMSKWSPVSTNVKMVSRVSQCQNGLRCQPMSKWSPVSTNVKMVSRDPDPVQNPIVFPTLVSTQDTSES